MDEYPRNDEAYEEWRAWRLKERKITIKPTGEKLQTKFLRQYPEEVQREIIEHSMMNDYQGLFPPKGPSKALVAASQASGSTRDRSLEQDLTDTSWAN